MVSESELPEPTIIHLAPNIFRDLGFRGLGV